MIRLASARLISSMKRSLVNESTASRKKLAVTSEVPEALDLSKMSSDATSSNKPAPMPPIKDPMVWIDLEMTGLEVLKDKIMEIAVLITDGELNIVKEGPNIVIHQDDETLDNMNSWCVKQHGETGLTQACRESQISVDQAEDTVMLFLRKHLNQGQVPLAGNSVYVDRKFLCQHMPRIDKFLHYRIVDVSSVKMLCKNWYAEEYENCPEKTGNHRAMDDIKDSVKELQYYRKTIFKPTTTTISDSD